MSAEIRKSTVKISKPVYDGKGQTVCQADIIVPDSMPDCLKILQVEGRAVTESRIITKGKISVRGRVECEILYVPENAGGVRCISNSIPFAYSENVAEAEDKMFFETKCDVKHLEFQLANSRKINVKAVVETEGRVTGCREIQFVSTVAGEGAEMRTEKFVGRNRVICKTVEFDISESIPMPGNAEVIVKTCGELKNRDIKIINNKVVAKGEIGMTIMYRAEGENLDVLSASVPFTEILDAEGINDGQQWEIDYNLKEISARLAENEAGKEARCNIAVEVNICSDELLEFEGVTDIYGTEKKLVPHREKITLDGYREKASAKIEVREIVKLGEDAPPVSKIFGVWVKPYSAHCNETVSGVKTDGEVQCSVVYISEKEDEMVHTEIFNLPFCATVDMQSRGTLKTEIKPGIAEYTLSGNNIELRIPLEILTECIKSGEEEIVTEVKELEEDQCDRPAMVLCFVQKGDSVWEIAKRYHSRICDIERINKISGEEIQEGMMLLIPKK